MHRIAYVILFIALISCKKVYQCVCRVNVEEIVENCDGTISRNVMMELSSKEIDNLGKLSKKDAESAKTTCHNRSSVEDENSPSPSPCGNTIIRKRTDCSLNY
jgi:hypothetical protein